MERFLHENQNENVNSDWIWGLAVTIGMFKDMLYRRICFVAGTAYAYSIQWSGHGVGRRVSISAGLWNLCFVQNGQTIISGATQPPAIGYAKRFPGEHDETLHITSSRP